MDPGNLPVIGQGALAARDPVCGMSVDPRGAPSVVHAGRTFHFCCPSCAERFRSDPGRYVGKEPGAARPSPPEPPARGTTAAPPAASAATRWTCPMHPEVV